MTSHRFAAAALLALLATACSPGNDATLGIGFDAHGPYADLSVFRASIRQGGSTRVILGSQLDVRAQSSDVVSAGREGIGLESGEPVTVHIVIDPGADAVIDVPVTWTPQKDWGYGVGTVIGPQRPSTFCANVVHAEALPARGGTVGDSLFVLTSGLPKDAIC